MHLTNTVQADQVGPISFELPCGADLEYDVEFIALQQAATGSREQQFGDALIPAVAPDWRHVAALAIALLGRTVDLRIIALLTLAWTELDHLAGYAKGLALAADVLDQYWEHVHPQLQAAGEFDPLPRFNAIAALTDQQALGRSARGAALSHGKFSQLSLREAAAILEGTPTPVVSLASVPAASLQEQLRTSFKEAPEEFAIVKQLLDSIERIDQRISANLGSSWVPDSGAVTKPLQIIYEATCGTAQTNLASAVCSSELPQTQTVRPAAPVAQAAGVHETVLGPMPIRSRNDVLLALENVCVYLESAEPGHPAPLLLHRVQRLLQMSFYEIVRDMAPAGLPQLEVLAGETQLRATNASI